MKWSKARPNWRFFLYSSTSRLLMLQKLGLDKVFRNFINMRFIICLYSLVTRNCRWLRKLSGYECNSSIAVSKAVVNECGNSQLHIPPFALKFLLQENIISDRPSALVEYARHRCQINFLLETQLWNFTTIISQTPFYRYRWRKVFNWRSMLEFCTRF